MKRRLELDRIEDSQSCYVYNFLEGPGGMVVKFWLPRKLIDKPPEYVIVEVETK